MDGVETMEAPTPCVITVSNELGEPRYPQLRQIMAAAKKEVKVLTASDLGIDAAKNRVTLEALFVPEIAVRSSSRQRAERSLPLHLTGGKVWQAEFSFSERRRKTAGWPR